MSSGQPPPGTVQKKQSITLPSLLLQPMALTWLLMVCAVGSCLLLEHHFVPQDHHFSSDILIAVICSLTATGIAYLALRNHYHELTHRLHAQEAAQEAEERARLLAEHSLMGVYLIQDDTYRYVNPAMARIFGYTADEIINKLKPTDLSAPEDVKRVQRNIDLRMAGVLSKIRYEYNGLTKEGAIRRIEVVGFRVTNGGRPAILGTATDITEPKQTREALRESEERFQTLARVAPVGIFLTDIQGKCTYLNDQCCRIMGMDFEQAQGDGWLKGIHPEDQERMRADWEQTIQKGYSHPIEARFMHRDGQVIWFTGEIVPEVTPDGTVMGYVGTITDISERKSSEETHARLIASVQQVAEAIVITDIQGTIAYVNPAFEKITGYTQEEVLGKNPRVLKSGVQKADFYQNMWATLGRGEVWSSFVTNKRKNGTLYEAEMVISPVRDTFGNIMNYASVQRDVTHERMLEHQLRHVQKMEAVGRLAGGVAHDFNNVLMAIMGYCDLSLCQLPEGDSTRGNIEEIQKAAERAASLTRQLLAFSRKQVIQPLVLDLNAQVTDAEKMLKRLIGEDIRLISRLSKPLGRIKADPGQIQQVVMNLAVNSRDAMPNGGELVIESSNVDIKGDEARNLVDVHPGSYVMLMVSDTGCGMTAEVMSHIFEPFFTTKELGRGTGLGLATVYGIVKQNGGFIHVTSEPGKGTTFQIYFPRFEEELDVLDRSQAMKDLKLGTETILLVEDATPVRDTIRTFLTRWGYTVLEAKDGPSAIDLFDHATSAIHVMLTDMVMPGMNGLDLAKELKKRDPDLKVIYMSGYTEATPADILGDDASMVFLQKPFNPDLLAKTLSTVLGRPFKG